MARVCYGQFTPLPIGTIRKGNNKYLCPPRFEGDFVGVVPPGGSSTELLPDFDLGQDLGIPIREGRAKARAHCPAWDQAAQGRRP